MVFGTNFREKIFIPYKAGSCKNPYMFVYKRTLFLRETDATGGLYFPELFKLALEAFEAFLIEKNFSLKEMLDTGEFHLPIVHAEADFKAPMHLGDVIEIRLAVEAVGTKSYTLSFRFFSYENVELAHAKIVQAAVSRKTGRAIALPKGILDQLRLL
jgi:1,4-dihydroxy-2-naphthoyl-CoA hydrolase